MMLHTRISYYEEFECLGDRCPDCCCKGWRIPLTDEDVSRFNKQKGWLGFLLRASMRGDETLRVFSDACLCCPFVTLSGLCDLQLKKGHDFLPETCRVYPRSVIRYMDHTEHHLDLSCIRAAELFLKHRREQKMIEGCSEEAGDVRESGNNEDPAYLEALLDTREEIVSEIRQVSDAEGLNRVLKRIGSFTASVQRETLSSGRSMLQKGDFLKTAEEEGVDDLFPLPIEVLNELMSTDFCESSLKCRAPFLYRLCQLYYRRFDRLDAKAGQELLLCYYREQVGKDPEEITFYSDYAVSVLLRHYAESFEDYSPYLKFEDLVILLNLLLLFRLLYREANGKPAGEEEARILSSVEKRFFHNEKIQKQLRLSLTESSKRGYHKRVFP